MAQWQHPHISNFVFHVVGYLFDTANSHGRIGEQVRSDIENWLNIAF